MTRITIRKPIWNGRKIGIASYRIIDNLEIDIAYRKTDGEKLFPHLYFISKEKALTYPTQNVKGTTLHIIPIKDLEIVKGAKKYLDNIREYFIRKGVFNEKN